MKLDLAAYLARHSPLAELTADWDQGRYAFLATGYLTPDLPPLEYVTSVRAPVFRRDAMLCVCDGAGVHLFPGGRREPGETLRREVPEESGYRLAAASLLGFMHFHHLNPAPPNYPYPYPDFVQLVYGAETAEVDGGAPCVQGDEEPYEFRPIAEVQALNLSPSQRHFLNAALQAP